jgi:2-polyprenyl-6-methoxyphenol hydroxylase-like FAD-dependent oxidoreductase
LGLLDRIIEARITGLNEVGAFTMWDNGWNEILKMRSEKPKSCLVGVLRIARDNLRGVLIECIGEVGLGIEWGVACMEVLDLEEGKMRVKLSNGEIEDCDILVAADGASSKLRAQMRPNDTLDFAGVCCITSTTRFATAPPAPIDQDWCIILSGTGTAGFASPVDAKSALWSLSYPSPTPREVKKAPIPTAEIKDVLDEAVSRATLLPPLFTSLIESTDPETLFVFNAMDKKSFTHSSKTLSKLIFVGDANHAVSPFAGNSANLALMDGWDLAEQLLHAEMFGEGVKVYDGLVVGRSKKVLEQSHFAIHVAHSTGWRFWLYFTLLKVVRLLFLRI